MNYLVTTFYKFTPLEKDQLPDIKKTLEQRAKELDIWGLTLIAPEGINATIVGREKEIGEYKQFLNIQFGDMFYKDSPADTIPFKRFKVKIKPEIVQLQRTDIVPTGNEKHVSPEEWDAMLEQEDMLVLDVRNAYEIKLGSFKKAINPQTGHFSEFPHWLQKSGISKEKKIGIFCTGGIRCEKAAVAMKEQGYEEVYQLDGGILNYIQQRPHHNFEGECFVFDGRAAVDQNLRPSTRYGLCVNCGNGGDIEQTCVNCKKIYRTCDECLPNVKTSLCSRNCRYRHNFLTKSGSDL